MKITAIVEQAADGVWSASTPGAIVNASTREEALQGVQRGIEGLLSYLKAQGWELLESNAEFVDMEV